MFKKFFTKVSKILLYGLLKILTLACSFVFFLTRIDVCQWSQIWIQISCLCGYCLIVIHSLLQCRLCHMSGLFMNLSCLLRSMLICLSLSRYSVALISVASGVHIWQNEFSCLIFICMDVLDELGCWVFYASF